jgi:branched-chain amino acid aminotransferase
MKMSYPGYEKGYGMPASGYGMAPARSRVRERPLFHSDCIWMEGELVPLEEATARLLSPAVHVGPGVSEGVRCYATERGPGVFRLEAHLQRFLLSVRALGVLDFRWAMADLRRAVAATVQANSLQSCYIRPALYFGDVGLEPDNDEPRLAVAAWEWQPPLGDAGRPGIRLMVTSFTPMQPSASLARDSLDRQVANSVLARSVARRAGFDEAILLDAEGYVAGCTGENLFAVRDGVIYTTPRAGVPEGIARDTVITLAGDLGYRVVEQRLSRDQLYTADELFVCGAAAEVVPAREIDSRPVGGGQIGPVSAAIQSLYVETARGRGARSAGWVEYVIMEPLY